MIDFYFSHQIGFAVTTVIALALSIIACIAAIFVIIRTKKLHTTTRALFKGKKGIDLEDVITSHNERLLEFDEEIQELFDISNKINKHARSCLHKVGLVRFNPFGERAGNQSFALALLDSKDNGMVLSSLHTREGTRIYSKNIINGQPVKNELTEEEKEAIKTAQ